MSLSKRLNNASGEKRANNQYILEAKYLDKIRRVKRKTIVGVYPSLEAIEKAKEKP